MNSAR